MEFLWRNWQSFGDLASFRSAIWRKATWYTRFSNKTHFSNATLRASGNPQCSTQFKLYLTNASLRGVRKMGNVEMVFIPTASFAYQLDDRNLFE